jgi:hypothetical protein
VDESNAGRAMFSARGQVWRTRPARFILDR